MPYLDKRPIFIYKNGMSLADTQAHLGRPSKISADIERELNRGADISIINLVDAFIAHAFALRASDIHIEPNYDGLRVRLRIDGVLHDSYLAPKGIHAEVISRIKVLAGLRTDEHQAMQDGRLRHSVSSVAHPLDIRISIAPTYHGETAVLRLLSNNTEAYVLESFDFREEDRRKILRAIQSPSGMILSTGPTGSGKTTTLYTLLKILNTKEVSIVTIEDPIEYAIHGTTQIQVNNRTGVTFGSGLRSILRQDPDIIMVGEIRDAETAHIAVNTALTGHLLLSTLHTNDAATTLPRLLDMGIDGYLVASTISIAMGQRLVRRICPECKEEIHLIEEEAASISRLSLSKPIDKKETFFRGRGCDACQGSGYQGRACVNEVIAADDDIRNAIMRKASASELKALAVRGGMRTMADHGVEKARAGETTLEEVVRVLYE